MDSLIIQQQEQIETLRERVRQLLDALAPPEVVVPMEWMLSPAEAKLFAHLTTRDLVTKSSAMAALYSDRHDDDIEPKIVDVFICKIRAKLRKFGVEINTVWGHGYSLSDRSKYAQKTGAAA